MNYMTLQKPMTRQFRKALRQDADDKEVRKLRKKYTGIED